MGMLRRARWSGNASNAFSTPARRQNSAKPSRKLRAAGRIPSQRPSCNAASTASRFSTNTYQSCSRASTLLRCSASGVMHYPLTLRYRIPHCPHFLKPVPLQDDPAPRVPAPRSRLDDRRPGTSPMRTKIGPLFAQTNVPLQGRDRPAVGPAWRRRGDSPFASWGLDSVPARVGEFGHLLVGIAGLSASRLAPAPPTVDTQP